MVKLSNKIVHRVGRLISRAIPSNELRRKVLAALASLLMPDRDRAGSADRQAFHHFALSALFDGKHKGGLSTVMQFDQTSTGKNLSRLASQYLSDKGSEDPSMHHPWPWPPHNYTAVYELLFAPHRYVVKCIVECGIGTNHEDTPSNMTVLGKPGASLFMWRDYFPHAQVVGIDIDERVLFTDDRIVTYQVDQTNPESISAFWESTRLDDVDIFIDDGLHEFEAGICLFEGSINHLSPSGFYIIEDVGSDDLERYRKYFQSRLFDVSFISLFRETERLADNSLVVVRNIRPA